MALLYINSLSLAEEVQKLSLQLTSGVKNLDTVTFVVVSG